MKKYVVAVLVVFLASYSASQTVETVDNFERGSLDHYVGDTGNFSIHSSWSVDGTRSLTTGLTRDSAIYSGSGLNYYPSPEDTIKMVVRPESYVESGGSDPGFTFFWGGDDQSTLNSLSYTYWPDPGTNSRGISLHTSNDSDSTDSVPTIDQGDLFSYEIEWGADETTARLYSGEFDNLEAVLTADSGEYKGDMIGYTLSTGSIYYDNEVWVDDVRAVVPEPDFNAEVDGPNQITSGSVAQYFATIENKGGKGSPGELTIEREGDSGGESWEVGDLAYGDTFEESRFVSFGSSGDYQVCAELSDDSASDCMTVTVTDPVGGEGWKDLMNFELDLTGPDSGIGWDENDGAALDVEFRDGRKSVFTDIYWQGTYDGSAPLDEHEQRMCGDDQREYLLEEMGESVNSEKFVGRYACVDDYDHCVYRGTTGQKVFDRADKDGSQPVNTDEPGESEGRLKKDKEICAQRPGLTSTSMSRDYDPTPQWYDQDYANNISGTGSISVPYQNLCRENSLYGEIGVRWINKDYIQNNPQSVTGGIDDSWNPRLEQMSHPSLESKPEKDTYSGNILENGVSPVPTGDFNSRVAKPTNMDYGFCGGDDEGEYLITQRCESGLCDTENSYIGVVDDPNKCLLEEDPSEESGVNLVGDGKNSNGQFREIYDEGEAVTVQGEDSGTMACFGGTWNDKWPVNFARDRVEVPLGGEDLISFQVINVVDEKKTFELDLSFGGDQAQDMDSFTTFDETGTNQMTASVEASSSENFNIRVRGNKEVEDFQDVELQAESRDGGLQGYDNVEVRIVNTSMSTSEASTQTRDVPGITLIQFFWIMAVASALYFISLHEIR